LIDLQGMVVVIERAQYHFVYPVAQFDGQVQEAEDAVIWMLHVEPATAVMTLRSLIQKVGSFHGRDQA
jgi:hypothetical protein